jgi:NAD-dependent dihydropyrimidine dehydrogenase PreA subunit
VNDEPKAKTSRWAKLASSAAANSLSMDEMPPQRVFLPDFCSIPVVFSVVLIGELLSFILVLAGCRGRPVRARERCGVDESRVCIVICPAGVFVARYSGAPYRRLHRGGEFFSGVSGYRARDGNRISCGARALDGTRALRVGNHSLLVRPRRCHGAP